jgi:hypothetical protein
MASLQKKNALWHCQFFYAGKRHTIVLGTISDDEAEAFAGNTDLILLRLKQGLLTLPPGVGIKDFILSGGMIKEKLAPSPEALTFAAFVPQYLETRKGTLESNSLDTITLHLRQMERTRFFEPRVHTPILLCLSSNSRSHKRMTIRFKTSSILWQRF